MKFSQNSSTEIADFYKKNGFVIIKDLFQVAELDSITSEVLSFWVNIFGISESKKIERNILNLNYKNDALKEKWKSAARRMWDSIKINSAISKSTVVQLLHVLGLRAPIIATRVEVRTDMSEDNQYRQPWHQDWRYGQTSLNSVTMWVPTHDVTPIDGTVEIIPETHLLGLLKVREEHNPRRFIINDNIIKTLEKNSIKVSLAKGECVFFSQFTLHQSGVNQSGLPRLTFQGRYADIAEKDFISRGFPAALESLENATYLPDSSMLKKVFDR